MSTLNSSKKKRSWVWVYYEETTKGVCRCNMCQEIIHPVSSSTTELIRHLKIAHEIDNEIDSQDIGGRSKRTLEESDPEFSDCEDNGELSSRKRLKLDKAIMRCIVDNNLAIRLVESDSFKDMFKLLNSKYTPPTRHMLRNILLPKQVVDYIALSSIERII